MLRWENISRSKTIRLKFYLVSKFSNMLYDKKPKKTENAGKEKKTLKPELTDSTAKQINFSMKGSCFDFIIVIENEKIVWKHGSYCWYFCLNSKYLGRSYRACIKAAKNGNFCEELLRENDFKAVLATFCCYDLGFKASEAIQKITTDQKECRKSFSCVIICWIGTIYQSKTVKNVWLKIYLQRS